MRRHARRAWQQLTGSRRRRRGLAACTVLCVIAAIALARGGDHAEAATWPRSRILDAIRFVESGGRASPPDGDGGLAIGPYQIHEVYWLDATGSDPSIGGDYQDCRDPAYAERVVDAYMRRYAPDAWEAGDAETIARTHNGGPRGAHIDATLGYWQRVREELERPR